MATKLSFQEIHKLVKKDKDSQLIKAVDTLAGLVIVCSPAAFGASAAAVLGLVSAKNEITKLGQRIVRRLTTKKGADFLERQRRMEIAYCLICYTSFFDAVAKALPALKKRLGLKATEQFTLSKVAAKRFELPKRRLNQSDAYPDAGLMTHELYLPHPVDDFDQQTKQMGALHEELAKGFIAFLEGLALWEKMENNKKDDIIKKMKELPSQALQCFKAQYYNLAAEYNDFFVWSCLHEHDKTRKQIKKQSEHIQKIVSLYKEGDRSIDLGFKKLGQVVRSIPEMLERAHARHVVEALDASYHKKIDAPILKDERDATPEQPRLVFPKNSEIYVPQAFSVVRMPTSDIQLEDPSTWIGRESPQTLTYFLMSYLSSPYSTETPLLILGHPGSGKSLLTKMLAARLISPLYNPIRVVLRTVNASSDVQNQIEEQIREDTGDAINWAELSRQYESMGQPPLIILDGYDELLQTSGNVFSQYLVDVCNFQQREASIHRPVRVIVTSRITLIDKAHVPAGSTVVRLREFDEQRIKRWIGVWNRKNAQYFRKKKVFKFSLPDDPKLVELGSQPLLLSMLAIYDSESNELANRKGLDQTALYDDLLRRFVEREREKSGPDGRAFESLTKPKRKEEIARDMRRLGVAAIGMFNRRTFHILEDQLNKDLAFFKLERTTTVKHGTPLSQAALLLGGFFFVHEAKTKGEASPRDRSEREERFAYEFLHNTFGEFLCAYFLFDLIVEQTDAFVAMESDDNLKAELQRKLERADAFPPSWFASLMFVPLYSKPAILDMLREWAAHRLASKRKRSDFLRALDAIVQNQIRRVLRSNDLPPVMQRGDETPFGSMPILGHAAVYSLNLTLLRTVLSPNGYTFHQPEFGAREDEGKDRRTAEDKTRPWDQLTYLWRSWFSRDSLLGLPAIVTAQRSGDSIHLTANEHFTGSSGTSSLASVLSVSLALADDTTAGLAGLLAYDEFGRNRIGLEEIATKLRTENIDLDFAVEAKRLRHSCDVESNSTTLASVLQELHSPTQNRGDVIEVIEKRLRAGLYFEANSKVAAIIFQREVAHRGLRQLFKYRPDLVMDWIGFFTDVETHGRFRRGLVEEVVAQLLHARSVDHILERRPDLALDWLQILRNLSWSRRLPDRMIEMSLKRLLQPRHIDYFLNRRPDRALEWIRFLHDMAGRKGIVRRTLEESAERIFHTRYLDYFIYRRPDLVVAWFRLLRDVNERVKVRSKVIGELVENLMRSGFLEHSGKSGTHITRELMTLLLELALQHSPEPWTLKILQFVSRYYAAIDMDLLPLGLAIKVFEASETAGAGALTATIRGKLKRSGYVLSPIRAKSSKRSPRVAKR